MGATENYPTYKVRGGSRNIDKTVETPEASKPKAAAKPKKDTKKSSSKKKK